MVDFTRNANGTTRARLLDLVSGRSGTVYKAWLSERGTEFTAGIKVATSEAFGGYKSAIDAQLGAATAVWWMCQSPWSLMCGTGPPG